MRQTSKVDAPPLHTNMTDKPASKHTVNANFLSPLIISPHWLIVAGHCTAVVLHTLSVVLHPLFYFLVGKRDCLHVFMTPQAREPFLLMGQDILYNNIFFPDKAAARAVCFGTHAARGTMVTQCGSARLRTLRMVAVVVVARLARCARSGRCSWRLATIILPKALLIH